MLTITKDFAFDSSHRLHVKGWSDEKNKEVYGKCNNEPSHGHTYKLSVTLIGEPDESGMMINFTELKRIVNSEIIDKFDHLCLNDLYETPSTCEIMVKDIFKTLFPKLNKSNYKLHKIDLYEKVYPTNSYATYQE